jgi:DNA-binding MltR family transcriptional regulator
MRSPKPPDRDSAPRPRRRRKDGSSNRPTQTVPAKPSLKKLGREIPTIDEFNQIDREVLTAHDRAVAILLVSQVERFLEMTIISHLFRQDDNTIYLLIARDGPLSSFYSKITLGYAMGFITDPEKDDLNNLREIRNAFAHTLRPITFKTEQIASRIDMLHAARGHSNYEEYTSDSSIAGMITAYAENQYRVKFVDACRKLSLQMLAARRRG